MYEGKKRKHFVSCGNNKRNAFITDGCGTPISTTRRVYHILSGKVNGEVHKCVREFLATFVAERICYD